MSMTTIEDVAESICTRLRDLGSFPTLVPGNIWYDRAPDTASGVYAVFRISAEKANRFSTGRTLQAFIVEIGAYANGPVEDIAAVRTLIADAMNWKQTLFSVANGTVKKVVPDVSQLEIDEGKRAAEDVPLAKNTWRIVVESNV
jgi:hypothetical protein